MNWWWLLYAAGFVMAPIGGGLLGWQLSDARRTCPGDGHVPMVMSATYEGCDGMMATTPCQRCGKEVPVPLVVQTGSGSALVGALVSESARE